MTQMPSLEEVDERLRALSDSDFVAGEDARALTRLDAIQFPEVSRTRTDGPRAASAYQKFRPVPMAAAIAAILALVVLANVGAAYYAPRYGRALAGAPGVGPVSDRMLQFVGVSDRNLTVFNAAATSSGHTVRLVAAYADGLRTVFFLEVDGRGMTGNMKAFGMSPGDYAVGLDGLTMTDQFGHRYSLARGNQIGVVLTFEPLTWPASELGARLTLHVSAIEAEWLVGSGSDAILKGDWTLHATLISRPVHTLILPAPLRTADAAYTFTSMQTSGTTVTVQWSVNGASVDEVNKLSMQRSSSQIVRGPEYEKLIRGYFSPKLFDAAGKEMTLWDWGYEFPTNGQAAGHMTAFVPGPGRYRIQLGDALTGVPDQRWIVVQ
jgi:hypothetical protein